MNRTQVKHQAIIKTATALFLEHGFTLTSMEQIAVEAGVSKMTLYHHFPNKTELFHAVISAHWHAIMQWKQPIFDATKDIKYNLTNFSTKILDFLNQQKTVDIFRLLITESKKFPELTKILITDNTGPFTKYLCSYLEDQVKKNQLFITDIELAAHQFLGLIKEQCFWLRFLGVPKKKKFTMDIAIEKAVEMFLIYYGRKQKGT